MVYLSQFRFVSGEGESGFGAASRDHAFFEVCDIGGLADVWAGIAFLGCFLAAGYGCSKRCLA